MKRIKDVLSAVVPSGLWSWFRGKRILAHHRTVADVCESLIDSYYAEGGNEFSIVPKVDLETERIIWQYWAQGYDGVPETVRKCLDSVDRFADRYRVIRLSDANLSEYLDIPEFVQKKRSMYSLAFFSDLLRCMLLSTYGGIWLDATVLLTAPIPREYRDAEFFLFQRDPDEKYKDYWKNTYAYYFGWDKGFRVNMLSSFLCAKKDSVVINDLSALMLKWWKENDTLPDYFFFQILFDVLINGKLKGYNCPIVSDCLPHYLQQSINDPIFNLMSREDILATIPIHKLTYKKQ